MAQEKDPSKMSPQELARKAKEVLVNNSGFTPEEADKALDEATKPADGE